MTLLQFSIRAVRLESFLLQCFRECRKALNFWARVEAEFPLSCPWEDQLAWTVSRKPGWSGQKFSNLNTVDFGMLVPIIILQGMWSEIGFDIGCTIVFGYWVVQFTEVKNQSNCSRRGSCCILLQVKALPFRGSSMRPAWPMASLKRIVSWRLPPGLFLSSRDL